jgi:tetratricopeptide (TPR) repeat protein
MTAAGADEHRVVQIFARDATTGKDQVGSGYMVGGGLVLTAAHVVGQAKVVTVRRVLEPHRLAETEAGVAWVEFDPHVDLAVLRLVTSVQNAAAFPVDLMPLRYGHVDGVVGCEAFGFPLFKLRTDHSSQIVAGWPNRDACHTIGRTSKSNLGNGTLEIIVDPPSDPDPRGTPSPWEGMSGAAVFANGALVALVCKHHRPEGPNRITARPVKHWYALADERIATLRNLLGLPEDAGRLITIGTQTPPWPDPPKQLPARSPFVGRERELSQLLDLLAPGTGPGRTEGGGVAAIVGLPGVGKTTLVTEAGHVARERGWFPGGQLFIDLRGYDSAPMSAHDALGQLLLDLGVPASDLRAEEQARATQFRSKLAQSDVPLLIVLDNVSSHALQVKPLVPDKGPHRLLVTSRHSLPQLDARLLRLDVLSPEESVALMSRVLRNRSEDDNRIQEQPETAAEIARLCGYLPLALRIATARLGDPAVPVAELAADLAVQRARLDRLDDGEKSVRAAFDLSYQHLASDEAMLFRLISLNGSPDISLAAAAAVAGLTEDVARLRLDRLVAAHLLDRAADRLHWTMHDLLWEYAALAVTDDPEQIRETARDRLLDYYNRTCAQAVGLLDPDEQTGSASAVQKFENREAASTWLDSELVNLVAAVTRAAEHRRDVVALDIVHHLFGYLARHFHYSKLVTIDQARLDIVRRRGDRQAEADVLSSIGSVLHLMSRFDDSAGHYEQALAISRSLGDQWREAWQLVGLGKVQRSLDEFSDARGTLLAAAALFDSQNDSDGRRHSLAELAMTLDAAGREEDARNIWKEVSAPVVKPGQFAPREHFLFDRFPGKTQHLSIWGAAQLQVEKINAASRALHEAQRSGDRRAEADALLRLSQARRDHGFGIADAVERARQAVAIFHEIEDVAEEAHAHYELGRHCWEANQSVEALQAFRSAERLATASKNVRIEAQALNGIGSLLIAAARTAEGADVLQRSADLFRDVQDARGEGLAMSSRGEALLNLGQYDEAVIACRAAITLCRTAGEFYGRVSAQMSLSTALLSGGRYEESIAASYEVLAECRQIHYNQGEVSALLRLGFACFKAERYGESLEWHKQALEAIPKKDHAIRARASSYVGAALVRLGDESVNSGDADRGVAFYMDAAKEYAALGDDANEGRVYQQAGATLLYVLNSFEQSAAASRRAVELLAEAGDRGNEAKASAHLGLSLQLLGQWDEACRAFERAHALSTDGGDPSDAVMALTGLGGTLVDSGRPEQGMPHLLQAIDEAVRIGDTDLQQLAMHNLAVAQAKLTQRPPDHGGQPPVQGGEDDSEEDSA